MSEKAGSQLAVTIFTDPLCCWSWAFEEQLQQLKSNLTLPATCQYRMGGLIPSWNNFHDHVNSVSRPMQMGPVWMHAGQIANKPIYHQLWMEDPPASSYPACIAVKCAQLQSEEAGVSMLHLLRESCMTNGKNIARQEILFEAADNISRTYENFDVAMFKEDFYSNKGMDAFRADLELVAYYRINRFPTLVVKIVNGKSLVISGYRRYEEILKTIESNCSTVTS
jgi:putative protein-disulfide isomerase